MCKDQEQGDNHTHFRLYSNSEFVAVLDRGQISIFDSVTFLAMGEDLSYARNRDLILQTTSSVTSGMDNIISNNRDNIGNKFQFNLSPNPNPFNSETTIFYENAESKDIKI